jgi:primosomal protein N' (replication factor Y)
MTATANHPLIARVVVIAPIDKLLSYLVPAELQPRVAVGSRVAVPLGRRRAVGYVVELSSGSDEKLKPILGLLDEAPLFHACHAAFFQRAAAYYAYPLGEAFRTALPAGLSGSGHAPAVLSDKIYRATDSETQPRGERQKELLAYIRGQGEASLSMLRSLFASPYAALQRLVEQDLLIVSDVERLRDPFAREVIAPKAMVQLNPAQEHALQELEQALTSRSFRPILLHGVTGSGKTEVYLRSAAFCLAMGRQALILVPEIALTPQLVGRFRSWFQHQQVRMAVLHSGLSDGERYDAWRSIARGDVDVVIGARSAIFAPLPAPGLIVVDEEHDASYKQSEGFRYNARDLAQLRGQMASAVVLLGSATPSLLTYHRANQGRLAYLELPDRVACRPLPEVRLVDLSQGEAGGLLSEPLQAAIRDTLDASGQILLLLNRRGYAPFLLCHDCGATCRCPNCQITLTFSQVQQTLRCHYCDYRLPPPDSCERCGGRRMMPEGAGTERLEQELRDLLPTARIARMDRDTTGRKGAHAGLIGRMAAREIDILVGTQMIAKGHDFPSVTLVGVLNADSPLNLPNFRSTERVFALFSQVAGRAGRGEQPGTVIIQTYDPEQATLQQVAGHDYRAFAENEFAQRRALGYPPFGHLVNLVLAGNDYARVSSAADLLAQQLAGSQGDFELLGPAPCLLAKLRGKHRFQILLKSKHRPALRMLVDALPVARKKLPPGVALTVDIDPLDMF